MRAAGTLVLLRLSLRLLPGDRVAGLLGIPLMLSEDAAAPPATSDTIAGRRRSQIRMLDLLLRHRPSRSRCLERSLAVAVTLRDSQPCLRIGVAREEGRVLGHAWVEAGGRSYLADPAFLPLGSSPGRRSA